MAIEYKLSLTAAEIDKRLKNVNQLSEDVDTLQTDVGTLQDEIKNVGGQINSQINSHNTNVNAHEDIRNAIPKTVSQLTNDAGYLTEHQSLDGLATETYVNTQIAAIPTPDVSGQISTHNASTSAHNDIRDLITGLTNRLNALADSDDTTLDQMSEVVAYIKSNKSLIEEVTTNKVNVADIIDNLTTNISNKPLSAAQGVALKALIDAIDIPTKVSELTNDSGYLTAIPAEYVTETELNAKGYLTEHQSLDNLATKDDLNSKADEDHTHPIATTTTAGMVMVDGTAGIGVNTENGNLFVKEATTSEIDDKQHSYKPITPNNLDYAVKAALVDNANSINSTERKAISEWLGMVSSTCIHKESGDITDLIGTESCRYIVSDDVTGMPIEGEWWFVDVLSNGYTDMTLTAYCVSKNPTQHIRICKNNVWSDWVNIATGEAAMVRIDENATGGLTNDTVDFWANKGTGYSWTSERDQVDAQPSQYGFVISYVNDSDVFQIFRDQESGETYFRSGDNVNGWFKSWKKVVTADGNDYINAYGFGATNRIVVDNGEKAMVIYPNGIGSERDGNVWIDYAGDAYFTNVYVNQKKVATQDAVDSKQDKLTGTEGQIVGFDSEGNAIAQDASNGGTTIILSEADPSTLIEGDYWHMVMTTIESPRELFPYTITLTNGTGYTLSAMSGSVSPSYRGDNYSFTVEFGSRYEAGSNFVVKANGNTLTAVGGVYTITNINSNQVVTVDGVVLKTYTVTLPTNTTGYTVSAESGSSSPVTDGNSYKFRVTISNGYEAGANFAVKANGAILSAVNGIYTISNITAAQTVTVEGVVLKTYTVTLPTNQTGYTVAANGGSTSPVNHGGSYRFTVTMATGYEAGSNFAVKVNGSTISASNGVYTISNITANQTITVEGVVRKTYTITLPTNQTGYTVTANSGSTSPVTHGGSYSFTVNISSGYEAGSNFAVKANGTTLTASNGVYTISNITANQTITVEGVTEIKTIVNVTGTGNTTYCYATINGTKRYGAVSNLEVKAGDTITFGVYGRSTSYRGTVTIDDTQVLNVTNQQTQTYNWTVPEGVKTITINMSYTSSSYQRRGTITVTTTK